MLLHLPHPMYVLHRKTVTTNTQNTTVKITKPIHPGVLEGSKKWEGKLHREKKKNVVNQSRHRSWQMLETAGKLALSDLGWWFKKKIHILDSGRFCLMCTRDKNSNSKRRKYAEGPWQWVLPSMAGGGKQSKELPHPPPNPTHPLWTGLSGRQQLSVWQEKDVEKGASLQRRSCSGLTAGRLSCGKVGCLKTPPRRRGATGKD